jgi:hypothetical protein
VALNGRQRQTVRLRRDPKSDGWYFGEKLRGRGFYADRIFGRLPDLEGCSATDLRRALRADLGHGIDNPGMLLSADDVAYYDDEECSLEPIEFGLHEDALSMTFGLATNVSMAPDRHTSEAAPFLRSDGLEDEGAWYDEDAAGAHVLSGVLKPFLERHRATLRGVTQDLDWAYPPWRWKADATVEVRGRSVIDAINLARDAIALGEAFGQNGEFTREIAADLVRAGHAAALIGLPEGQWLDVKSQHYDLGQGVGKIKLAQAVAKFANAEMGGLLIIGLSGKKVPGGEVLTKLCPVAIDGRTMRQYQQALESRLYPPPDLLSIEPVGTSELGLVLIDIPPQPEELKPFLVHGALIDGDVEGAFISIVRRRGESSIPTTAPMIHSTLAAGRALLRRGELRGEGASGEAC